ncbi:hypothetical protein ACZ91_47350 [Streptomyces regensis]|nr:hypothetical protein ACZ91_47350 [Streptomyces regensis]
MSGGYRRQRDPDAVFSTTFPRVREGRHNYQGSQVVFNPDLLAEPDLDTHERDCHSAAVAEMDASPSPATPRSSSTARTGRVHLQRPLSDEESTAGRRACCARP